jgi:hypothetical protein
MRAIKQFLAVILGILGVVGLVLCVAGVVAVWVVEKPLLDRSKSALEQATRALNTAAEGVKVVNTSLKKARKDLETFTEEARKPAAERKRPGRLEQAVADQLESNIQNIGATVNVVTDASVVLNSLLGSLNELPDTALGALDTDRLKDVQGSISDLTKSSQRLSTVLTKDETESDAQAKHMEEVLDQVIAWTTELQGKVDKVQADVDKLKSRTPGWIRVGTVAVTVALVWIGISQLTLVGFAVLWFRRQSTAREA